MSLVYFLSVATIFHLIYTMDLFYHILDLISSLHLWSRYERHPNQPISCVNLRGLFPRYGYKLVCHFNSTAHPSYSGLRYSQRALLSNAIFFMVIFLTLQHIGDRYCGGLVFCYSTRKSFLNTCTGLSTEFLNFNLVHACTFVIVFYFTSAYIYIKYSIFMCLCTIIFYNSNIDLMKSSN